MNKILKIFGLLAVLTMPAFADDDVAVDEGRVLGARTDCAAVASEIATINKTEDPDAEMLERLAELQKIQRRDCSKSTARRRAMGRGGKMANVVAAATVTADIPADTTVSTDVAETATVESETNTETEVTESVVDVADMSCDDLANKIDELRVDAVANADALDAHTAEYDARCMDVEPEKTPEEIAELIEAGFCADGTKPNRFGCCGDEKFKDLGDGVFGCCPPDESLDCFPPITTEDL